MNDWMQTAGLAVNYSLHNASEFKILTFTKIFQKIYNNNDSFMKIRFVQYPQTIYLLGWT